jgi:hypothetical protein
MGKFLARILRIRWLRACTGIIAGLLLIALGFIISAYGIEAIIEGNTNLAYVIAVGFFFIFMAIFTYIWTFRSSTFTRE